MRDAAVTSLLLRLKKFQLNLFGRFSHPRFVDGGRRPGLPGGDGGRGRVDCSICS